MSADACKCGHDRERHAYMRARCTVKGCDCIKYELKVDRTLLDRALTLDERLEVSERELRRARAWMKASLDGNLELKEAVEENDRLRSALRCIIENPLSTRADVQSIALLALQR